MKTKMNQAQEPRIRKFQPRISYYINMTGLPPDGKKDNRVWIVSIDKVSWRGQLMRYRLQGIFLRRTSGGKLIKHIDDKPWVPVVIDKMAGHARHPANYSLPKE